MKHVVIILFVLLVQSCLSASSWQTAETLKSGEGRLIFAGGNYTSPSINKSIEDAKSESEVTANVDEDELAVPYGELGYRYGFTDSFEGGLKLTLPSGTTADLKYNLLDTKPFDFALGLAYSSMSIETSSIDFSSGEEVKSEFAMTDYILPVYTSIRLGSLAFYLIPKYILRQTKSESEQASTTLSGGTFGVMLGQEWGVMLEATYLKQADSDFEIMQTGAAFFF